MAEIYEFPAAVADDGVPDAVWRAVDSVRAMDHVPGVAYREIRVPASACEHGIGVELHCASTGASGWIMVMYGGRAAEASGSAGRPGFPLRGPWRCAAFARLAPADEPAAALSARVLWDAAVDALGPCGAGARGTVSITRDTTFDAPDGDGRDATGREIRVSWTPATMGTTDCDAECDAGAQIAVWARFLASADGIR